MDELCHTASVTDLLTDCDWQAISLYMFLESLLFEELFHPNCPITRIVLE